jgi:hypothetical protein
MRVVRGVASWFERGSLILVIALSLAVILADADRRLSPELRLETFESQSVALWSVDRSLPDLVPADVVTRLMSTPRHLP